MNVRGKAETWREQLGQISWVTRRYPPRRLRLQMQVARDCELPALPNARRTQHSVWAVSVVRNERDVIAQTVAHLLTQGIDHVLIADNLSDDGTWELLQELSDADPRIHVARDKHRAHHQSEKITYLAHSAWRHGATWIVPFDADEFLFATEMSVGDFLRQSRAAIVHAAFHHMVPTVPAPHIDARTTFLMDSNPSVPGKVTVRAHPLLEIAPGNHAASRVGAEVRGLHIAHAIYRTPEQVARKFRGGMEASNAGTHTMPGSHWVKGGALDDTGVREVWDRISQGLPDERIDYEAIGPMVSVQPLRWHVWDEFGELAQVKSTL